MKINYHSASAYFLAGVLSKGVANPETNFLSDLFGDEAFLECVQDTTALENNNPDLAGAGEAFFGSFEVGPLQITEESIGVDVIFNETKRDPYKVACMAAGGLYDAMDGSITCEPQPDLRGPLPERNSGRISFLNYGQCVADTEECKAINVWNFLRDFFEALGMQCDVGTVTAAVTNGGLPEHGFGGDTGDLQSTQSLPSSGSESHSVIWATQIGIAALPVCLVFLLL
ncbi:unnamed protein product [Pseudo-nitzschia multistriata]|uniref:Uncharacterized protein n=1 Tax=Pseudo-nitzschia multistriata TaxID=183589 RepID=A0A448Z7T5_9STRA|nr:unnamed protein product [Pseudo-nitzschia multistriata]